MSGPAPFFIGWSAEPPFAVRRRMRGAGLALAAGATAGAAAVLAGGRVAVGDGVRDLGTLHTLHGVLQSTPFPLLRTPDLGGGARALFLATDGNAAALPPAAVDRWVTVTYTLITRGAQAMLAVERIDAVRDAESAERAEVAPVDLGDVLLTGEILDAEGWFCAMRPGFAKAHKACASLCARGSLPLAFCRSGDCGAGTEAPLFVDVGGRAHTSGVPPWVADPVFVRGRLVRTGDVVQQRGGLADIL